MQQHDIIIIGSGLGGLISGLILAKEGYNVGIVEQNKQIGGCLQTFAFEKKVFDSCVHYIGALNEGSNQRRIFDYLGISKHLKTKQLDLCAFDTMLFENDETYYPMAQGQDRFVAELSALFPHQHQALKQYIQTLNNTTSKFPLYELRMGSYEEKAAVANLPLRQTIANIITDTRLEEVLLGNSLLYAGEENITPFYVHALVNSSYMEGAYKLQGGSSQISKALWKELQANGATIYRNEKVSKIVEIGGEVQYIETQNQNRFAGKHYISNIHPKATLNLLETTALKPAFIKRIQNAPNSISSFMVNIVLQAGKVPYSNTNFYYNAQHPLTTTLHNRELWPNNYAVYMTEDPEHPGFADTVAILTYMNFEVFDAFADSYNTTAQEAERPTGYEDFKARKTEILLAKVRERFPEIIANIRATQAASPLTFRDYMGTDDGSMYGITKNVQAPHASQIAIASKIRNLYFTGQNVNLHGILGVSISAVATASHFVGMEYLLGKINAQH